MRINVRLLGACDPAGGPHEQVSHLILCSLQQQPWCGCRRPHDLIVVYIQPAICLACASLVIKMCALVHRDNIRWLYPKPCRVAGDGASVTRRKQHAVREVGVQARLPLWSPADEAALHPDITLLPSGPTGACTQRVLRHAVGFVYASHRIVTREDKGGPKPYGTWASAMHTCSMHMSVQSSQPWCARVSVRSRGGVQPGGSHVSAHVHH